MPVMPAPSRSAMLLLAVAAVAACAARREPAPEPAAPPAILTVPHLVTMVEQGTPEPVIYGEMQRSGTIYRLSTWQAQDLRASGFPPALLSQIELMYLHAVRQNPELARSDAQWKEIDGYWYGGLPLGWPREWVYGAPRLGEALR